MNNPYDKNLTSNKFSPTFDCGIYTARIPLLGIKTKKTMKLPLNIHLRGTFVFGSEDSDRSQFAGHYARVLVDSGVNVVFITDSPSLYNNRNESELDVLTKQLSLGDMDNERYRVNELTGKFNDGLVNDDGGLSVYYSMESKNSEEGSRESYHSKLVSLLFEISEDERMKAKYNLNETGVHGKFASVFIDEDYMYGFNDKGSLSQAIKALKREGIGVVMCGSDENRFARVNDSIGNVVIFHMYDPTQLDMFGAYSRSCGNNKNHMRLDGRDVSNLGFNEFHFYEKDKCGVTTVAKFDRK
ncbi:hypothetical protein VCHA53O466_50358 [Vibrio chagasii]|nr:hypothetical protein VCHA53O466_50358 [Vibrio chagasii]